MAFFTDEWVQQCTGRHRTTIARWRRHRNWPPEILRLARLEIEGELGLIDPRWRGWRLCSRRGQLFPPDAYATPATGFTPGELLALPWKLGRLQALEVEVAGLRERERAAARSAGFDLDPADLEAVDRLLTRLRAIRRIDPAPIVPPVARTLQGSG